MIYNIQSYWITRFTLLMPYFKLMNALRCRNENHEQESTLSSAHLHNRTASTHNSLSLLRRKRLPAKRICTALALIWSSANVVQMLSSPPTDSLLRSFSPAQPAFQSLQVCLPTAKPIALSLYSKLFARFLPTMTP